MVKLARKRQGALSAGANPVKRRKVDVSLGSTKKKARAVPKKEKAAHRPTIPIPHDEQSDESDEEPWDSDIENFQIQLGTTLGETSGAEDASIGSGSSSSAVNVEEVYERSQAMKKVDVKENHRGPERLPVKLPGGKVEKRGYLSANDTLEKDEESDLEESAVLPTPEPPRDDISTGARFGRPAVVSILQNKSRKVRILAAKEQLASICQEILADPENSLGLLRRLHSFSLPKITTPTQSTPVENDPIVRKLALISQLAVFKDIIPGYRIRPLTDIEKSEKVSQMVQAVRDYEQGLVSVYQAYLQVLEMDIKSKSELTSTAVQCLCSLIVEVPHFNFRLNIMSSIVAQLSRRSWSETANMCLNTLTKVLDGDLTGEASLELVRLLNRMIKELRFAVHPNVLTCLLHLRLKDELDVKSSMSRADRAEQATSTARRKDSRRKGENKFHPQTHRASKETAKAQKERKEIEEEMREAEAEVDQEDRSKTHTETLKLVFVLYFRILKAPKRTPLLPAALLGISRFAHLVNVDFFKDLLAILRTLVGRETVHNADGVDENAEESEPVESVNEVTESVRHRLMCIVTAFELLSGQGEALTIDLVDFVNFLYAILLETSTLATIEEPLVGGASSAGPPSKSSPIVNSRVNALSSMSDLLFRALSLVFTNRSLSVDHNPPWRSAAFSKRLLTAALSWPPTTACRAIDFSRTLVVRDPRLESMLNSDPEERVGGAGEIYRSEVNDPQLSGAINAGVFWELRELAEHHWDLRVREEAKRLMNFKR